MPSRAMKVICPLCESNTFKLTDKLTGYKSPQIFSIYQCTYCDTNFPSPQNVDESIYDVIYSQGKSHPGYDRYWQYYEDIYFVKDPLKFLAKKEINYFAIFEFIKSTLLRSSDPKILEVGSGLGYLTFALQKAGYDAQGIEISGEAVQMASDRFGPYFSKTDLYEISRNQSPQYDVVISTETIEHVENLQGFIEAMYSLVKKNGFIVLTTPNRSFFPADCIWESSLPPIHLWWLSEKAMVLIANKLNCDIDFIDMSKWHKKTPLILEFSHYIDERSFSSVLNSNNEINRSNLDLTAHQGNRILSYVDWIKVMFIMFMSPLVLLWREIE
jgi:SAM-dependent methyltransferase